MKKCVCILFFLALSLFLAAFVWQPLSFIDYKNYFTLTWFDGYRYKTLDGLGYFEKDLCESEDESCVCFFMVHGLGDQSYTWHKIMSMQKKLNAPSKMVAVDLPGAGASPPLADISGYQVRLLAERLHDFVGKSCGSNEVVLVGNSFGGWITSWMMEQRPQRYSKNVLLNPAGLNLPYDHAIQGLVSPSPETVIETYRLSHALGEKAQVFLPWFVARHASERLRHFPVESMIKAQALGDQFIDEVVEKIKDKTRLVWGMQDEFLGIHHYERFQALIGAQRVTPLKECAHVPQDQCPENIVHILNSLL